LSSTPGRRGAGAPRPLNFQSKGRKRRLSSPPGGSEALIPAVFAAAQHCAVANTFTQRALQERAAPASARARKRSPAEAAGGHLGGGEQQPAAASVSGAGAAAAHVCVRRVEVPRHSRNKPNRLVAVAPKVWPAAGISAAPFAHAPGRAGSTGRLRYAFASVPPGMCALSSLVATTSCPMIHNSELQSHPV
jgi:hypothetical protein